MSQISNLPSLECWIDQNNNKIYLKLFVFAVLEDYYTFYFIFLTFFGDRFKKSSKTIIVLLIFFHFDLEPNYFRVIYTWGQWICHVVWWCIFWSQVTQCCMCQCFCIFFTNFIARSLTTRKKTKLAHDYSFNLQLTANYISKVNYIIRILFSFI